MGLALVQITGYAAFDAIAALAVAGAIVDAGVRILSRSGRALVDEAPPAAELDRIEAAIAAKRGRAPEIVGYHKLRARRSGVRILVDLHLQFRSGTSLEGAHQIAHGLRDAIEAELPGSEVLIHLEPEGSFRSDESGPLRSGLEEVDRRRRADGPDDDRIADVALDREDQRRDRAEDYDRQPGGSC